ncbi:MAG: hypothetical protein H6831_03010 [Planctomycetes bacterium]|nr:hypothetical protein [Planctomycetota bacterium]
MKLATLFVLPFALALLPRAEHTAVELERARPLGFGTPYWERQTRELAERAAQGWPGLPPSVAARLASFEGEMLSPVALGRCNTPSGLELWILEQDHSGAGFPNPWRCFLRDPRTNALTPQTITVSNRWIESETPRVRFVDLDDDGRDELAFRQFEHNGTMADDDVELYFRVRDDLALDLCLEQRTDIRDLYSENESGAIRSQLMLTDGGDLVAYVWHESPRMGVPRVPIGRVCFATGPDGVFAIAATQSLLRDDEREQRYDFAPAYCFGRTDTRYRSREFPRSVPKVR